MNSLVSRCMALAGVTLLLGGCAKAPPAQAAPTVAGPALNNLVKPAERSPHFEAVDRQLERGGQLYGYVDVDGDALDLARKAQNLTRQLAVALPPLAAFSKQDLAVLFTTLGFDDIKAVGISSVREAGGLYRNRAFLYTPAGRQGLLAVFGGPPGSFPDTKLAPADADLFMEHEIDLKAVYDTVENVVAKVQGPEAGTSFHDHVRKVGAAASFSLLDLLTRLKGHATVIIRFEGDQTTTLPGTGTTPGAVIPATSGLVRIDGIGPALEPMVKAAPAHFQQTKDGNVRVYALTKAPKVEGLRPVLAFQGSAFFLAWNEDFLTECLGRTQGLAAEPKFAAARKELGPEGNGLTWVTPRFFDRLRDLATLNPTAPPPLSHALAFYAASLPVVTEPLLSVRTNLPDGILIRSHWNRSLKADLALMTIYNPVTLGLMASAAIPAFQQTRQQAQARAVIANLAALYRAKEAYCIAHQVDEASYDDLVGPGQLVERITPVAGESYRNLSFRKGQRLMIHIDGRPYYYPAGDSFRPPSGAPSRARPVITPAGSPGADGDFAVLMNLMTLHSAAERYYAEKNATSTTYERLVGPGKLVPTLVAVEGEDYHSLLFRQGVPLRLHLNDGRELVYPTPVAP